jgi:hypothetical protein
MQRTSSCGWLVVSKAEPGTHSDFGQTKSIQNQVEGVYVSGSRRVLNSTIITSSALRLARRCYPSSSNWFAPAVEFPA